MTTVPGNRDAVQFWGAIPNLEQPPISASLGLYMYNLILILAPIFNFKIKYRIFRIRVRVRVKVTVRHRVRNNINFAFLFMKPLTSTQLNAFAKKIKCQLLMYGVC